MIWTVLLFLAVLSILVLAHEWGHYAAARKMKMDVEEFGIGFPPRLFGFKAKSGTTWSINLIPLGGFVRIKGENGEERNHPGAFATKSIPARFLVLIAGVLMNLVVAWLLFTVGFSVGLPAITEGMDDSRAIISNETIDVVQVLADSPAAKAGLLEGDEIVSINSKMYESGEEARAALSPQTQGAPLNLIVNRDGTNMQIVVIPEYLPEIGKQGIGVALEEVGNVRYPLYYAPVMGFVTTFSMTSQIVLAFGGLIAAIFQHENVAAQLSGPVGIAVLTGQVAKLGIGHLIQFVAMLSVNLAVLNVLPFPALDGGRIFFLMVEALRRKPNSEKFEAAVHTFGFALLLLLVVFVTYKDIAKLF